LIRYRLDDLGWYQFEWLCQSLLKTQYGLAVESWGGHSDLGRDAFAAGPLEFPERGHPTAGPFVFQAKFVAGANAAGARPESPLLTAVRAECLALKRRGKERNAESIAQYVLMTNVVLSPEMRSQLDMILAPALPKATVHKVDGAAICDLLDPLPTLRTAFPQILSLRDISELLSAVVAKPILERSTLSLEAAEELAQVFVLTRAYAKALGLLRKHHFAVLSGPPEMGKTAIARIVGLAKLGEGWECFECRQPNDFFQMVAPDKEQVFIADDAFGATEYRPEIAQQWADDIERILRKLDDRHWFIWTSRAAPLKVALSRMHLQGKAEHFPLPSNCVVDAGGLTLQEKALILYRHAKNAALSAQAIEAVKTGADIVAGAPTFTPLRIRRLIERVKSMELPSDVAEAARIVKNAAASLLKEPTVEMRKSFESLGSKHKAFLIGLLDAEGPIVSLEQACAAFGRHYDDEAPANPVDVAEELRDHFVRIEEDRIVAVLGGHDVTESSGRKVTWQHPSFRDLVISQLIASAMARKLFLEKCGLAGIGLALSTYGGPGGHIHRPLLVGLDDWAILEASMRVFLERCTGVELERVLRVLDGSISTQPLTPLAQSPDHPMRRLIRSALEAVRNRWDVRNETFRVEALDLFYRLSLHVSPLPVGPKLSLTWESHWEYAQDEIAQIKEYMPDSFDELHRFITLASLIKANEPRFLVQVGFPERYMEKMLFVLDEYAGTLDFGMSKGDRDELEREMARFYELQKPFGPLADLVPALADKAREVEGVFADEYSRLESELSERYPEPSWDDDDSGGGQIGASVDSILEDL